MPLLISRSVLISLGVLFFTTALAEELPAFRPALIGNGPKSLINLIDGQKLMQKGQRDAVVMFACAVTYHGRPISNWTYRGTPGSAELRKEISDKFDRSLFMPAVYKHKERAALIFGTVTFAVLEGKPRIRIFLNQDADELPKGNDFIAPQPVDAPDTNFRGFEYPMGAYDKNGTVEVRVDVGLDGKVKSSKLISELPAGLGFGDKTMKDIDKLRFIPGFRNGKPVVCSSTVPIFFKSGGWRSWNSS